jgi:hypothetical protein
VPEQIQRGRDGLRPVFDMRAVLLGGDLISSPQRRMHRVQALSPDTALRRSHFTVRLHVHSTPQNRRTDKAPTQTRRKQSPPLPQQVGELSACSGDRPLPLPQQHAHVSPVLDGPLRFRQQDLGHRGHSGRHRHEPGPAEAARPERRAVGHQFAAVIEQDDAVAQQAPALPGLSREDSCGQVIRG